MRSAETLIQRALTIDPRHIVALKVRAGLLRAEGKFGDAIAASQVVIAQNPGEPWAYKEVGLSELYLGRLYEALRWFDKADEIGPRDPSRWIWLGAMGRVQFFLGQNDEAVRLLSSPLTLIRVTRGPTLCSLRSMRPRAEAMRLRRPWPIACAFDRK